jgi:hypothetical protein
VSAAGLDAAEVVDEAVIVAPDVVSQRPGVSWSCVASACSNLSFSLSLHAAMIVRSD